MISPTGRCDIARRAFVRSSMTEMPGVSSTRTGSFCSASAAEVSSTSAPVRSVRMFAWPVSPRKRVTICFTSISSEKTSTPVPWRAAL